MNQYVPVTAHRAVDPGSDDSSFTALLGAMGDGVFLPVMLILKCSTKDKVDLTSEATLKKLIKDGCFPLGDWHYEIFEVDISDEKSGSVFH